MVMGVAPLRHRLSVRWSRGTCHPSEVAQNGAQIACTRLIDTRDRSALQRLVNQFAIGVHTVLVWFSAIELCADEK